MRTRIPGAGVGQRSAAALGVVVLHIALLWTCAGPLAPHAQLGVAARAHHRLVIGIPPLPQAAPRPPHSPARATQRNENPIHEPHPARASLALAQPLAKEDVGENKPAWIDEPQIGPPASADAMATSSSSIQSPATPIAPATTPAEDREAEYLYNPPPLFPSVSRHRGEQGRVIVSALVTTDGFVKEAHVALSSGFLRLDEAAVAAVRAWRFVPAQRGGVSVEMRHQIPIRFELDVESGN